MAKVNPGELRRLIEVYSTTSVKEKGITKLQYQYISRLKCKVKNDKTKYFNADDSRKKTQTLIFICHKRDFLVEDNFILYNDNYYRITEIVPFEDYMYYQVFAEMVI